MKTTFFILIALTGITLISSCGKSRYAVDMQKITGSYSGTLASATGTQKTATADIASAGDYTVEVHCYGQDFDTTFTMDVYQDGDRVLCNNGQNKHMKDMGNHCNSNVHHGQFNTTDQSFSYLFNDKDGHEFSGTK